MGRRAPAEDARAQIAAWRAAGATVRVVAGDVAVAADVERIVAALAAEGAPVTGVIHAAGSSTTRCCPTCALSASTGCSRPSCSASGTCTAPPPRRAFVVFSRSSG
ncbi:MAG: KR domain-containing protein [Myxococcales bacterium]|nr:KR domain-containing protein [Myxococcales bacterium]